MKKQILIALASVCLGSGTSHGALSINNVGSATTIDFDSTVVDVNNGAFTGSGFQSAPAAGQLDSDSWTVTGLSDGNLVFGGTAVSGDFARGAHAGGTGTGGIYAFSLSSGNVGLGFQPGEDDWTPGTVTLKIQNLTGQSVSSLVLAYNVYVRNDQARANSFNFSYSADGVSFNPVAALDLVSGVTADSTPGFVLNSRSTTISGLSLGDSGFFYLRWSGADVSGSGSRDEFVLDDISVTGIAVPEPSTFVAGALLALPFGVHGVRYLRNRKRA